jgi:excisionase family DNA binding protein
MTIEDEWITVQDGAKLTGYGEQYLRRLIRNNRLKAKRLSFLWLVHKPSLLEYAKIAKQTTDKRRGPKTS